MMNKLRGKKTYLVGAVSIISAMVGYIVGDLGAPEAAQLIVTAMLGMTVRNAISN